MSSILYYLTASARPSVRCFFFGVIEFVQISSEPRSSPKCLDMNLDSLS